MEDLKKSYLLGLICGKGYLYDSTYQVAIEFAHSNEFIDGIAHCEHCGYMATKSRGSESLRCKNPDCLQLVPQNRKTRYEQAESTKKSIRDSIIPFLSAGTKLKFATSGNKSVTILVINFTEEKELFEEVSTTLAPGTDFSNFRVPDTVWNSEYSHGVEYLNGVLDATGYANAGSWMPRDGKSGTGRMRLYLQIVRNWNIVADLDSFIRDKLGKPVQTIDWGHPNIRDSNLQDYRAGAQTAWAREHQIKFFPEYFADLSFRISHKQMMFQELLAHNISCQFPEDKGWFPPGPVKPSQRKASHPGENDPRLPKVLRRHFDAFWQLNLALGSISFRTLVSKAKDSAVFALTGDVEDSRTLGQVQRELAGLYSRLNSSLAAARLRIVADSGSVRIPRKNLERETYAPLVEALTQELTAVHGESVYVYDTSAGNLSNFVSRLSLEQVLELEAWDAFDIRPDVVGFVAGEPQAFFIESKIEQLTLKHLGQLLGYCAAAQPKRAILVSTLSVSESLVKAVTRCPDILNYGTEGKIELAQLINGRIVYSELNS
jgi:hypothetical protein